MLIDKKEAENLINIVKRSGVITEESGKRILNAYNYIVGSQDIFEKMFVRKGRKYSVYTINAINSLDNSSVGKLTDVEKKQLQVLLNTILNGKTAGEVDEYTIGRNYEKRYVEMMASDINIPTRPDWGVDGYDPQKTPPLLGRKSYLENRSKVFYRFQKGEKLTTQERVEVSSEILNRAFPNVRFQYAWHSTPHDFDAFTLDHLLEGEGCMAHGWGLYFAKDLPKNKNNYFDRFTRQSYRKDLVEQYTIRLNGLDDTTKVFNLIRPLNETRIFEAELKSVNKDNIKEFLNKWFKSRREEAQKELSTMKEFVRKREQENKNVDYERTLIKNVEAELSGQKDFFDNVVMGSDVNIERRSARLFLVDIPNDDVLIRKRAKLKDQPQKVQKALYKLLNDIGKMTNFNLNQTEQQFLNAYGNEIIDYDYFANTMLPTWFDFDTGNKIITQQGQKQVLNDIVLKSGIWNTERMYQELTSKLLNKYGIKGVSYNGRKDGECVVVFDNKAIDIINKFKKEEGKWVSNKPQSQKQELTDTQKQRV